MSDDQGLPIIATRAQAEADQMWEELRACSSRIVDLKNKLKAGQRTFDEADASMLDFIACAAIFEIRVRNIHREML